MRVDTTETSDRLRGKVALVTGAASGIGRATAERLRMEGAQLVVTAGHSHEAGQKLAERLGNAAIYAPLDVTDPTQWESAIQQTMGRFGKLDILVNNAGITVEADIETTGLPLWNRVLSTNLNGTFLGCQSAIAAMEGEGSIINIGSIAGVVASPQFIAYGVSKAALEALTRSVAAHCRRKSYAIRCNIVHPGTIDTPMMAQVMHERNQKGSSEAVRGGKATGAMGQGGDVAALVTYLASDESHYVTGASVIVDNGLTLL